MTALVDTTTGEVVHAHAMRLVPIDDVIIGERGRDDLGDLDGLAASIAARGLIHPPTVEPDLSLVAGQRRIEALRKLGRTHVQVYVVDRIEDAAERLRVELEENTCRKAMTASEQHALGKRIEAIEAPEAADRQTAGLKKGAEAAPLVSVDTDGAADTKRTREVVAPAVGLSQAQWGRLKHIGDRAAEGDEFAAELLAAIDAGAETISGGYRKLRQHDITEEPDARGDANGDGRRWVPFEERAEQVRELAETGHLAAQIATKLDIGVPQVKSIAKRAGITLPDKAVGNTRRIDQAHVINETVITVEAAASTVGSLVDLDRLDPDPEDAREWATSLSQSLRTLTSLRNRLKKVAHDEG